MIGINRLAKDFAIGTRVVSARDRRTGIGMGKLVSFAEMRVETVTEIDRDAIERGNNARMTLAHGDEARVVHVGHTSIHEEGPWRIVWSDPIASDDATAIRMIGDILHLGGEYHRTVLLWIAMREDDVCYAHQLWDHDKTTFGEGAPSQRVGPFRMSAAPLRVLGFGEAGPGDVIACLHEKAALEGHLYEHTVRNAKAIAYAARPDSIPAALPWHCHERNRNRLGMGDLAGPRVFEEAEELAYSRTQPSQAFVVAWEVEGHSGRKDVSLHVVGSSGIAFHNNDDAGVYLEQSVPGPGLWMFENASMHAWTSYEGEHDAEMDGDWRPATMEDVLENYDDCHAAARDLMGYLEENEPQPDEATVVEDMIARAVAVIAAESVPEAVI